MQKKILLFLERSWLVFLSEAKSFSWEKVHWFYCWWFCIIFIRIPLQSNPVVWKVHSLKVLWYFSGHHGNSSSDSKTGEGQTCKTEKENSCYHNNLSRIWTSFLLLKSFWKLKSDRVMNDMVLSELPFLYLFIKFTERYCIFCHLIFNPCIMNTDKCVALNENPHYNTLMSVLSFLHICVLRATKPTACWFCSDYLRETVFHQRFLCSARILTMCCELESDGRTLKRGNQVSGK